MTTSKQHLHWFSVLLSILLCTLLASAAFTQKTGFDTEEIWSFAVSNSTEKPYYFPHTPGTAGQTGKDFDMRTTVDFQQYFYHWHDGSFYHEYLTVQKEDTFSYESVLRNAAMDEHPPLYFLLLHTVCSFFPDSFSGWYAFLLNLLFYAASLFLLYRIARSLLPHALSVLVMVFWGLSQAGIGTAMYLRMYMLLTCLTLLVTWLHLRLLQRFRWQELPLLFLAELAGFLTHHYFLIYAFLLTAASCLCLLYRKQTGKAAALPALLLGAMGIALLLFPAMISQITMGFEAKNIERNLTTIRFDFTLCSDVLEQVTRLYTGIPLPSMALYLLLLLGAVLATLLCIRRQQKNGTAKRLSDIWLRPAFAALLTRLKAAFSPEYRLLLTILLLAGMVINLLTEQIDGLYVRYLFPLLPLFALPMVTLLQPLLERRKPLRHGKVLLAAVILCLAAASHLPRNIFLSVGSTYKGNLDFMVAGHNLILVNHQAAEDHAFAPLCRLTEAVYPAEKLNGALAETLASYATDTPLLLIFDSSAGTLEEQTAFLTAHAPSPCTYLTEIRYPLGVDRGYYVFRME